MKKIHDMTLEEKVGQLFMAGFQGTEPSENITKLIRDYHIGGVIYFTRNVKNTKQVYELSRDLQKVAVDAGKLPLFISIDQEGGMVARITEGVTLSPGNMALGAAGDKDAAYRLSKIVGKELRALGVNMNFAPCVDVNNNPLNPVIGVRSYGEDPRVVAQYGVEAVKGLQAEHVSAVSKHFPGHGDTNVDSHLDLPVIAHDLDRLESLELVPFKETFAHDVDGVMVAHINFKSIEPDNVPSTLSKRIVSGLLREKLGYDGVAMTDCMEMNAIIEYYGIEEASVMAIEAGIDIVLISHTFERQYKAIEAVKKAVESGRLTLEQVDRSVARVLKLKEKRMLAESVASWEETETLVGSAEDMAFARSVSEKSMTLVKDSGTFLPLSASEKVLVVAVDPNVATEVDETLATKVTVGTYLKAALPHAEEVSVTVAPSGEEIARIVKHAGDFDKVVVATYQAVANPSQVELVRKLVAGFGDRVGVVAMRSPYDIGKFVEVATYLVTYESRALALESASKVLLGRIEATGKLPITLLDAKVNNG
ncbi:beta-N-acetylhexosaminidase [Bacillus tianshenii]|uniref:beta-N-acetylhexosaminidase n=1 Tax=Sutcliffiella tianshenii TaxID=1463404 RepID=UPI001CD63E7B|nr:beta-N-acetylhexosaminidase [Bacillus tianshenii]MCA1318619.1 beta-N-acetylhexosaminidase [Bacillus tianshenii]